MKAIRFVVIAVAAAGLAILVGAFLYGVGKGFIDEANRLGLPVLPLAIVAFVLFGSLVFTVVYFLGWNRRARARQEDSPR